MRAIDRAFLLICFLSLTARGSLLKAQEFDFFEAKIRPILIEHCYECHSSEATKKNHLKSGLNLDSKAGLVRGGDRGPALTANDPRESLLFQSIAHLGDAPHMPPKTKLSAEVIADFETWIQDGAPDPREASEAVQTKKGMSLEEGRTFWSLLPPQMPSFPSDLESEWPQTVIDRFVRAKQGEHQLRPSGDASPHLWLRRITIDLTGLPPTLEAIEEIERDSSLESKARIVDRLLSSRSFGERWGRIWLDGVRYADSNGRDRNMFWYDAWRYRDYVIDAFNADLPYDQFVREQIAGDLMEGSSDVEKDRLMIATGFMALGPKAFEEQKLDLFRMDVVDEQIEVIGRSLLGLSIGCSRCHDHKFDPIPTADYYAIAGILRSSQPLYGYGPKGIKATNHSHTPLIAVGPKAKELEKEGLEYLEHLNRLTLIQNTARSDRYRIVRKVADAKIQIEKPGADRVKIQSDIDRMNDEIKEWDIKVKAAEKDLQDAMDHPPELPGWAMGIRDRDEIEDCKIHIRGETTHLGNSVPRGALQVLPNPIATIPPDRSGRLELAHWIASRQNPLTARVWANRIWQQLFGKGLVSTPDDFGVNGSRPSHPELLDYLAIRLMNRNWSTKGLIREIVLSRSYQQSSDSVLEYFQKDPDNIFLWRMSPKRLQAESLRDSLLASCGSLDLSRPDRGSLAYLKLYPWRDVEFTNFKPQFMPKDAELPLRSIYLPVVRGVLPVLFQNFDFASPDRPVAIREESNVPTQSLFLMNNPWVLEQCQRGARRLLAMERASLDERLDILFREALGRSPSEVERQEMRDYLGKHDASSLHATPEGQDDSKRLDIERWASLYQLIYSTAEFRFVR